MKISWRSLLLLLAFIPCSGFAQETDPCLRFSLEGIRVGMTMAEARATLPGAKIKKTRPPGDWSSAERKLYEDRTFLINREGTKAQGQRDRLFMWLNVDEKDRVVRVLRQYTVTVSRGMSTATEYQVEPDELLRIIRDRFGEPTWDSVQPTNSTRGSFEVKARIIRWDASTCKSSLSVQTGHRSYHPGVFVSALASSEAVDEPYLVAILQELGAENDDAGVVKF